MNGIMTLPWLCFAARGIALRALWAVEQDPRDDEARLWLARLALRLGRTSDAEAGFRAVLARRPSDVDAAIGLGMTSLRTNDWRAALAVLEPLEANASDNADLLATLARAYRRGGEGAGGS